ncbi:MAG: hypothetical protein JO165_04085 [Candidatus Eremiobacteraeota bacterium]|nr:hypothetical protein [Candidatus Eremiobacteraeota bacterium]
MTLTPWAEIARWSVVASSVIFAMFLVWMFRKFIVPAIEAAQRAKNEEIAAAERHLADANERCAQLEAEVARADSDAAAIRRRGEEQGGVEYQATVREATEAGERALRNAGGELDRARAVAREQLRTKLVERALDIADARAAERVDANVNERLIKEFVNSLQRGGSN